MNGRQKVNLLIGLVLAVVLFIFIWPATWGILSEIWFPTVYSEEYFEAEGWYHYGSMKAQGKDYGDRVYPIPVCVLMAILFNAMPLVSLFVVPVVFGVIDRIYGVVFR